MNPIQFAPELQNVLRLCYQYWLEETTIPEAERIVCWSWINPTYEQKYGKKFHPGWLRGLADCGYLEPAESSRKGGRRYYKLKDIPRIKAHLNIQ